jgi:hypothetical protein
MSATSRNPFHASRKRKVGCRHQAGCEGKISRRGVHNTPQACVSHMAVSVTARRPKISALCWPSLGATVRTRTLSPILIGVQMCGTSPNSVSLAYCTRPRWRTCGSANIRA